MAHSEVTLSLVSLSVSPGQAHTAAIGSVPAKLKSALFLHQDIALAWDMSPWEGSDVSCSLSQMSPAGCGHLGRQPLCRQRPHVCEVCPAQGTQARVGVTRVAGQVAVVTLKRRTLIDWSKGLVHEKLTCHILGGRHVR